MARCKAMSRTTGKQCGNRPMIGVSVCRMHGGKAAIKNRGKGNGNYSTGRHTQLFKSVKLHERYERAMNDPELLEHRRSIAVLDALLDETLKKIKSRNDDGESDWGKALRLLREWKGSLNPRSWRTRRMMPHILRLEEHLKECAASDRAARADARKVIMEQATVTDRELQRLTILSGIMTMDQARDLLRVIMDQVATIKDDDDRVRITNSIIKIAGFHP